MEALSPHVPATIGEYTLGALLGRGGMSDVYACAHPVHGDRLALKLLRDDADGAFHVEAAARAVEHPSVVRVLDAALDPATRRHYLVMERLDGPDLATHLARGPLDEPAARALLARIADGMHAVHARGIVHRDLKPANVMLHAGAPRIVDFGIAKLLGDNAALVTSRRIGTLGYMAPEQLVGGKIAPSVDVWALGVMLFEAVTGQLPFDGFTESYTPQLVETAPRVRTLADVSPAYDALVAACLDPDPARRPPMVYVARALRGEVAIESTPGERVTQDIGALPPLALAPVAPAASQLPAPVAPRRGRVVSAVAAIAGAIAALAITWAVARGGGEAAPAAPPEASASPTSSPVPPAASAPAAERPPVPEPREAREARGSAADAALPPPGAPRVTEHPAAPSPKRAKRRAKPSTSRRETLD